MDIQRAMHIHTGIIIMGIMLTGSMVIPMKKEDIIMIKVNYSGNK